jgi:tRNA dimethylallyltransferase
MTQQNRLSRAGQSPFFPIMVGLTFSDRETLYRRIDRRVDEMLQNGLVEEARNFFKTEGAKTAAQAIGHKELKPYLEGEKSLDSCAERLKRETRRYAKRQLTWFRRDARIQWFYVDNYDSHQELTDAVIHTIHTHGA